MKNFALLCGLIVSQAVFAQPAAAPGAAATNAARADNAFGFKLLAETRKAQPGGNVFQSPVGLALALAMATDGAHGETLRQMAAALQWEGASPAQWDAGNKMLLDYLSGLDSRIQLEIANSLWTQADAKIKPEFIADCQKSYRAEAAAVDFQNPATVKRINDWASQNTHGKIPSIFDPPLPAATRLILLDAIYFKGSWEKPFDQKLTRDQPFTLRSGQTIQHPRMTRTERMSYFESEAFQAVTLPYLSRQASLCVFLPRQNLDQFMKELTRENWEKWTGQFSLRQGTLELPRFKLENKYELKGELTAMGMPRAFSLEAEFGGISEERLLISRVVQKTFVEVNEVGTEAAAVSGIGMMGMAIQRPTVAPFTMIVDRPFYVVIRENQTGAILFHGTIEDPR
jgi:serpin B